MARRGMAGQGTARRGITWSGKARFSFFSKGFMMYQVITKLKSATPYSQSRHYLTDKKPKESAKDYEERTWRDRMHVNDDGYVFIPPMSFKNCLDECAKYLSKQIPGKGKSTYTKHVEAGVLVMDPLVLPIKAEEVRGEWLFVPSDGMRGGGKRVDKCFPLIPEWSGSLCWHVYDETVTLDVFKEFLTEAGKFIGIGRFRPRNRGFYGRFSVESFKVV